MYHISEYYIDNYIAPVVNIVNLLHHTFFETPGTVKIAMQVEVSDYTCLMYFVKMKK